MIEGPPKWRDFAGRCYVRAARPKLLFVRV